MEIKLPLDINFNYVLKKHKDIKKKKRITI